MVQHVSSMCVYTGHPVFRDRKSFQCRALLYFHTLETYCPLSFYYVLRNLISRLTLLIYVPKQEALFNFELQTVQLQKVQILLLLRVNGFLKNKGI